MVALLLLLVHSPTIFSTAFSPDMKVFQGLAAVVEVLLWFHTKYLQIGKREVGERKT